MPLSPHSQARHAAAIISTIDAGFPPVRHSRREIPDSEDDSEDPNTSIPNAAPALSTAMALRTTTQQHRHLDSLPTYLANRALRHHHEADLEAAAAAAESNASDGCDAMELCEEVGSAASGDQRTITTAAATNVSAVGTTGTENGSSSATGAGVSGLGTAVGGLVLPRITIPPRRRRRRDGQQFEIFDEEAVWEEADREDREGWWGLRIG